MTLDVYAQVFPVDLADGVKSLSWLNGGSVVPPAVPQEDEKAG